MSPRLVFKFVSKPTDSLDQLNAVDWSKACGTNLKTSFSKFYLTLTLGDYFIELIRHFICIQKLAEVRFKSSKNPFQIDAIARAIPPLKRSIILKSHLRRFEPT